MLFLLFLFIIPSAIGVYFILKPPVQMEAEVDIKPATIVVTQFKGLDDIQAAAANSNALLRKQTVNE